MDCRTKCKVQTTKLLEKKAINLHGFGLNSGFLDMTLKVQATEGKNKLDFIKVKKFCASKDTIKEVKTQPMELEKNFAHHIFDKGLGSRIHKEYLYLHDKKTVNPIEKWAKELNRHCSKEGIQMAKKHKKNAQYYQLLGKCKSKPWDTTLHINQLLIPDAKSKKPDTKGHILYDYIYMKCPK